MDFDKAVYMSMNTGAVLEIGRPVVLANEAECKFGDLLRAANKQVTRVVLICLVGSRHSVPRDVPPVCAVGITRIYVTEGWLRHWI